MSTLVLPSSFSQGFASTLLEGHRLAFAIRHVPRRQFFRIDARNNAREESAKIRNRRMQRKYNGSARKPRLSVFCSNKQLYAMLVDDQGKKTLFYGSTLQKSIRGNPPCTSVEAAQKVGEELIKACKDLNISEISSYDRNGCKRGERMSAFEPALPLNSSSFSEVDILGESRTEHSPELRPIWKFSQASKILIWRKNLSLDSQEK